MSTRDFPEAFYIAWVSVIIVVLVKLVADLIEITYNRFSKRIQSTVSATEELPLKSAIPKGWLIFSLALVGVSILAAVVGPALAPYGWNQIMLQNRMAPPGPGLLLGADNVGRDILSRVLTGIRIDVSGGLAGAGIAVVIATGWAVLAERLKKTGKQTLEQLVMLPVEILRAFPWLVLLPLLLNMWRWEPRGMAGLIRVAAPVTLFASLVLLPRVVVMIRETVGSSTSGKDWLQSVLRTIPVVFIFTVAGSILYISASSYLGIGVPPPYPELGGMLSSSGRQYMMVAPWMALWPALILSLLLFTWVMVGDALLERMGFRSKTIWSKTME